jgi:hypothetical protein
MPEAERKKLAAAVDRGLTTMADVFRPADPLLASPSYGLLYFLFLADGLPSGASAGEIRDFLEWLQHSRAAALEQHEDARDEALVEFSGLMQHGAGDRRAVARRLEILRGAWERYRAAVASGAGVPSGSVAGGGESSTPT